MDMKLLDVAAGKAPADTVITGGKVVATGSNLPSGSITSGNKPHERGFPLYALRHLPHRKPRIPVRF